MPTVDWESRVINVPLSDLTLISTGVYQHDIDVFRLALKDLEDGEGMPYPDTHRHNTAVTISGITIARVFEIINGYTITYEDGQYRVVLVGANNNIIEVANVNQVSIVPTNSAGLIQVNTSGGTFTATDRTTLQSANTQATTAATNTGTLESRLTETRAANLDDIPEISNDAAALARGNIEVDAAANTLTLRKPDGTILVTYSLTDENDVATIVGALQRTAQ